LLFIMNPFLGVGKMGAGLLRSRREASCCGAVHLRFGRVLA
jgi:hypothetical protein